MNFLNKLKSKSTAEVDNGYSYDDIYYNADKKESTAPEVSTDISYADEVEDDNISIVVSKEPAVEVAEVAKDEPLMKKTFTPDAGSKAQDVVNAMKDRRVVVIYLEELRKSREDMTRFLDYVMGAVQALDATLNRIDRDTCAIIPYDVDADVAIDELEEAEDDASAKA